jgi:hypothetical protein
LISLGFMTGFFGKTDNVSCTEQVLQAKY